MAEEFIKFQHLRMGHMAPSIHPTEQHFPAAIAKSFRSNLKINKLLNQKISMQITRGPTIKGNQHHICFMSTFYSHNSETVLYTIWDK